MRLQRGTQAELKQALAAIGVTEENFRRLTPDEQHDAVDRALKLLSPSSRGDTCRQLGAARERQILEADAEETAPILFAGDGARCHLTRQKRAGRRAA
jgi:hypothetical protein